MSNLTNYRPSKRPKVSQVEYWDTIYTGEIEQDWRGLSVAAKVENGRPFPDFYRVKYKVGHPDSTKWQSKLFYGESAWNETERFVYDMGLFDVLGKI